MASTGKTDTRASSRKHGRRRMGGGGETAKRDGKENIWVEGEYEY